MTEPSFLSFVSRVNEEFVSRDPDAYDAWISKGKDFKLNLKSWLLKCKDDKVRREELGAMLTFREFAEKRMVAMLIMDIDNFVKELQHGKVAKTDQFVGEYENIRSRFDTSVCFDTVRPALMEALERVPVGLRKGSMALAPGEGIEWLSWKGSLDSLCRFFQQRIGADGVVKGFDYPPEMLAMFICKHFRDREGKEFNLTDISAHWPTAQKDN